MTGYDDGLDEMLYVEPFSQDYTKKLDEAPKFALPMDPKQMEFYIRGLFPCGMEAQIMQRNNETPIWEMILTAKPGTKLSDSVQVIGNQIKVNMQEQSAIVLFQYLGMILAPRMKRKKFLGVF